MGEFFFFLVSEKDLKREKQIAAIVDALTILTDEEKLLREKVIEDAKRFDTTSEAPPPLLTKSETLFRTSRWMASQRVRCSSWFSKNEKDTLQLERTLIDVGEKDVRTAAILFLDNLDCRVALLYIEIVCLNIEFRIVWCTNIKTKTWELDNHVNY